jgi:heme-degrading monooxygenase HmoA
MTLRNQLLALISSSLAACAGTHSTPSAPARPASKPSVAVELAANPNLEFHIDAFSVPAAARSEFETAMHENAAFLESLPGFKGHLVFEKTAGPTTFNIVTIAVWENVEAMKHAAEEVQEHYRKIGFDMQAAIARWGVTASIGNYNAPQALQ